MNLHIPQAKPFYATLILFWLHADVSYSQDPWQIPQDATSEWRISTSLSSTECYINYDVRQFIKGDTLIGGKSYSILEEAGTMDNTPIYLPPYFDPDCDPNVYEYHNTACFLRSDSGKVYCRELSGIEYLIYDFTLGPGDTMPNPPPISGITVIARIDSVLIGTSYHKRFTSAFPGTLDSLTVIEGIGLVNESYVTVDMVLHFYCYSEYGTVLYGDPNCQLNIAAPAPATRENNFMIFPNPATNMVTLSVDPEFPGEISISVKDAAGKRMIFQTVKSAPGMNNIQIDCSALPSGIYILTASTEKQHYSDRLFIE